MRADEVGASHKLHDGLEDRDSQGRCGKKGITVLEARTWNDCAKEIGFVVAKEIELRGIKIS